MTVVDRAPDSPDLSCPKSHYFFTQEHVALFLYEWMRVNLVWFVVYSGMSYLTRWHAYRVRLWTEIDMRIPFVPDASLVYLSLFPMLWLSALVLDTRTRLRSFANALTGLILLSGAGFLLFPCDDARAMETNSVTMRPWFRFADQVNLSHNYLPSLHVGMAVVCAYTYSQFAALKMRTIYWCWAIAIGASTLVTHQHYLADVVTGAALGYFVAVRCTGQSASAQGS